MHVRRTTRRGLLALGAVVVLGAGVLAGCGSDSSSDQGGMSGMGNDTSMSSSTTTKTAMANQTDTAFVRQMVPHHQMAVQMANMAKQGGVHAEIKSLADDIVAAQNAEIAQMQSIAEKLDVKPGKATNGMQMHSGEMSADAKTMGLSMDDMGMSMNMQDLVGATPFDKMFIDMMITHHQGAIRMAQAELASGVSPELRKLATAIVAAQTGEIEKMNGWRESWYGSASPSGGVPKA